MHDTSPFHSHHVPDAPLFSIRQLCYGYPDGTAALDRIDLEIGTGERIALVGKNGSGKTTLIKQLCGLLTPNTGHLKYKGKPLEGQHLDQSRLKIGLLFQDPDDQLFSHTLADDVAFGPRQQGLTRQVAMESARQALHLVGLDDKAYKAPHNLSFGQKKRAALAGLLAMSPEVLLLDEPTANLDPYQEEVFLDLLKTFKGTLVCISHDLIFLYELCDRAVVLDAGEIQHDYTMRELVSQQESLRAHGLDFSFRLVITESGNSDDGDAAAPITCSQPAATPVLGEPVVALRDFDFRYPDGTHALDGIRLTIHNGERIAIVGENGAGKTTLLSCLLGVHQGKGEFLFEGEPVTRRRRKALWRHVGMVFQDSADQLFCPSVEEEISFGLRQMGLARSEIRDRVAQTLEKVRLKGFEQRVPLHMSGGERKRLALASVLAMQPRLLILDEPTAGLDPQGEELLLSILRNLQVTLLLVSHDMFFVRELTCRTLVMHQGRILEDIPIQAFLQDRRLGSLNGLAYSFRQRSSSAIRQLQHEHEVHYEHSHLHAHPHHHDGDEHDHLHEHLHAHPHRYVHSHPGQEKPHHHPPRRLHQHDHHEDDIEDDDHR